MSHDAHHTVLSHSPIISSLFHPNILFSSLFCNLSTHVHPLMSDIKFRIQTKLQGKMVMLYFHFYVFRQQTIIERVLDLMISSIIQTECSLDFLLNGIWFCCCRSKIFELGHVFKRSVTHNCFHFMIFPCILVLRQQHILSFLCVNF
jgi:hypothetical protein